MNIKLQFIHPSPQQPKNHLPTWRLFRKERTIRCHILEHLSRHGLERHGDTRGFRKGSNGGFVSRWAGRHEFLGMIGLVHGRYRRRAKKQWYYVSLSHQEVQSCLAMMSLVVGAA